MHLTIDIVDEHNSLTKTQAELVERLVTFVGEKEKLDEGTEVSISFVDNEEIQELNRDYRAKDVPTDVLSFPMEELGEGEVEIYGVDEPKMLGDIVVSVDKIIEQAEEYRHSFDRELGFLVVHGMLHLLGYDHMNESDEKVMFDRQKQLLIEFGLGR